MHRIIPLILAALLAASALASCAVPDTPAQAATSSADAATDFIRSRLGENAADSLVIASGEDALSQYADLASFSDDGYVLRRVGSQTAILAKTDAGLDRAARYYVNHFADSADAYYAYGEGYRVKALSIAGRDIADYAIRIAPDADECHRYAASELQKYIEKACGAHLDIVTSDAPHMIVLEQITEADPRFETLGDEGFTISVRDNGDLYITGGRYRGCMYGVYELLEKYVGWRFIFDFDLTDPSVTGYTKAPIDSVYSTYADAKVDYLYEADSVDIPAGTNDTQTPGIAYRQPVESEHGADTDYYLKVKENGVTMNLGRYNGYGIFFRACHGSSYVVAAYPDYEGLTPHSYQPCFTDPDLIDYCAEHWVTELKNRVSSGEIIGKDITTVDVSQSDTGNFCTCQRCRKQFQTDGCHMGEILTFANGIAAAVAEEVSPEVYCAVLSYYGTTAIPAKTRPASNVSISYCFYNDLDKNVCYAHPFSGDDCMNDVRNVSNVKYGAELRKWCEVATQVIVWYYPGTWYAAPLYAPNVFRVYDDIRFLAECGVYGIFVDSSQVLPDDGIITYLEMRLMWDPYVSRETFEGWVREYLTILYGPGADGIYDFMVAQDKARPQVCWTTHAWSNPAIRINGTFARDTFDDMVYLFNDAAERAETSLQEHRVIFRSLTAYFNALYASYETMYKNGSEAERETYKERWLYFAENARAMHLDNGMDAGEGTFDFTALDLETTHPGTICGVTHYGEEWWNSASVYLND